jgi:hypothetical protein
MSLTAYESEKVEKFFAELAPLLPAYRYQTVRFLAARTDKGALLLHLVLLLSAQPPEAVPAPFRTKNVLCRELALSETGYDARALVEAVSSGRVILCAENFGFPSDHSGNHTAHAWPFDGTVGGRFDQVSRLMIQGDSQRFIHLQNQDYHREVKANVISYDSVPALGAAFGLEFQDYMNFCADIYASRVASILELAREDDTGIVKVWLAAGLSPEEAIISVRFKTKSNDRARPLELPAVPVWQLDHDGSRSSEIAFGAPDPEAILSVVISYAGVVQHQRDFVPRRTSVNSLRMAIAPFQPKEDAFLAVLANERIRDRNPQELEHTVAAILAMRGFRVITADRIPNLQEAPDILAADADGNILVVECTLNLPHSEDKLAKLHRRREAVRRAFKGTRQAGTEIIAVLAISQPRDLLRGYQEQTSKLQILMWTREDLSALAQDNGPPNSQAIYAGLRDTVGQLSFLSELRN